MGEPKPTERLAETIQGKFRTPLAPVGSLSPANEQARAGQKAGRSNPRKEKSVSQRDQQKQFAARFPALETQRFDEQLSFLKAETVLNCLKLQKRLMFGRANFDLLRLHVLRRA